MQIAADAVVRNNIVLGNVSFQSHQAGSPSNIEFVHNTVINDGSGIEVRNVSGPVLIANNAVYSQSQAIRLISGDLGQVQLFGNVGAGGLSGGSSGYVDGNGISIDMVAGNYNGAPPIDPFPAPGSALIGAGDPAYITAIDFNGNPRGGSADAGAYAFDPNGNPGWTITPGSKRQLSAPGFRCRLRTCELTELGTRAFVLLCRFAPDGLRRLNAVRGSNEPCDTAASRRPTRNRGL